MGPKKQFWPIRMKLIKPFRRQLTHYAEKFLHELLSNISLIKCPTPIGSTKIRALTIGSVYILFIKYRTANHFLPVETLRWEGVDINERKCTLCDKLNTADEFHYLLSCKYFDQQREQFIKPYLYHKRPNILQYKELFNSKSLLNF